MLKSASKFPLCWANLWSSDIHLSVQTLQTHQQHWHLGTGVSSQLPHLTISEQRVKQCFHAKASVGLTV